MAKPSAKSPGNPLAYPADRWTCPLTGVVVAKDPAGNAAQRKAIYERADSDPEFRSALLGLCGRSFLLWVNLFGWTYVLVDADAEGRTNRAEGNDVPFVTWPCQDAAITEVQAARDQGRSVCWEKSREMGASWLKVAETVWACMFKPTWHAKLMSRKEEEVDADGGDNPDTLFFKVDYLLKWLPEWMRPRVKRQKLHRTFLHNGNTIQGESTNKNAGRSGRRNEVVVDEAAAIDNLRQIERSVNDTTPFVCYISTVIPGAYFSELCTGGRLAVVSTMWWDHPAKGKGRELVRHESGDVRFTSPWYRAECRKRDERDVAENLDADHRAGGKVFFSARELKAHAAAFAAPPVRRGRLRLTAPVDMHADAGQWPLESAQLLDTADGKWLFFDDLEASPDGRERADQSHTFVLAADVSEGVGASRSAITAGDADLGRKVARWACSKTDPHELADLLYIAGYWFGGRGGCALIVVESNGPGNAVLARLRRHRYPRLYQHVDETKRRARSADAYGWHSTRQAKRDLLSFYRGQLARHEFQNPDQEALDEARSYINYDDGGVGPMRLVDLAEEARAAHGDLVIADALCALGIARQPYEPVREPPAPPGSVAWRQQERKYRERQERARATRY